MIDQIAFLDPSGRRRYMAGWTGPWPPPEQLTMMIGSSGYTIVVAEDADPEVIAAARQLGTITETRYRLRNCSAIPEPAKPEDSWFRGAEYVPDLDD